MAFAGGFTEVELAKEQWRHQQCAAYLRSQLESQQRRHSSHSAESRQPPPPPHAPPSAPAERGGGYSSLPGEPAGGGTPSTQQQQASTKPAAEPNTHDKVWRVFEYLDANGDYKIDRQEWHRGVQSCNIPFTEETLSDLFDRAAPHSADAIASQDWSSFARRYPVLIDCLHYRSIAISRADSELKESESARPALAASVRKAEQADEEARRDDAAEQEAADREARALRDADAKRAAAEERLRAHRGEAAAAAAARAEAQRVVQQRWPEIQKRNADAHHALRAAEVARGRLAEAADRERALEQALADARAERERAQRAVVEAEADLQRLRADRDGPDPEEQLEACDKAMADCQRQERESAAVCSETTGFADRQRTRAADAARRAQGCRARAEECARALDKARAAEAANDARHQQALATKAQGPGRRADGSVGEDAQKENRLVEEEVRLRQQRDELERRESVLREEHNSFSSPRRASEQTSPGGPPPAPASHRPSGTAAPYSTGY